MATTREELDLSLLSELYEEIERHPPGVEARKLLVQQFIAAGWDDAVREQTQELLTLVSLDPQVLEWHKAFCSAKQAAKPAVNRKALKTSPKAELPPYKPPTSIPKLPDNPAERARLREKWLTDYEQFSAKAKALQSDALFLDELMQNTGAGGFDNSFLEDVESLAAGKIVTLLRTQHQQAKVAERIQAPGSARAVARAMEADPKKAVETVYADLCDMSKWLRSRPDAPDNDALGENLAKRVKVLRAALPKDMQPHATTAMMHIEHELLGRTYVNDETMLGDPISDIPRTNFYVTEDGYAWDMEELAQAITANSGVMRNPLSKQMFAANDIRAIVQHPLGKALAALQIEQSRLKQGVRDKTIDEMNKLWPVLLKDQSDNALDSRKATDEFLAYVATLPQAEQTALDGLRVPARDSHTGMAYDTTIGEAVRDAQGNRTCFHKTGDFIRQAAAHLRKQH